MEKRKTYADKKKYFKNYSIQKCDCFDDESDKKIKNKHHYALLLDW
jgi:hypothetical protein